MNSTFQPLVSWPFFFGILLLLTLASVWPIFQQAKKGTPRVRLGLKIAFLLLFLFSFAMALLRPSFLKQGEKDSILVYGKGVEREDLDFWKDSLGIRKTVQIEDFKSGSSQVYLLGSQFQKEELYTLKDLDFEWILPGKNGEIAELSWKGFLRKGEVQRLSYSIFSEKDQAQFSVDGIEEGKKTFVKGWNSGILEFPISGQGLSEIPLILDADTLAWMRFYIGPSSPKKYHFISAFPNPELRNLSQWLRNKGESVSEEIQLSRDTQLSSGVKTDSLQVIFLDPKQLGRRDILNLAKDGKVALVIWNISNPQEATQQVNRALGTDFQVEKITQESTRTLENGVEAMPFGFAEKQGQKLFQEKSLAIQSPNGYPIALSLINATFPLVLEGNAQLYEKIWGELISELEPEEAKSWRFSAPVLAGFEKAFELNQSDSLPDQLILQEDTIFLSPSPINPHLAKGNILTQDSTWIKIAEDLTVYSYSSGELPSLSSAQLIKEIKEGNSSVNPSQKESQQTISPWIWLVGMLLGLGMLWLEPKLDY